ncbi:hypothetical protein TrRE_jg5348 [Triparma retinervis]|uniref:Uncharacterized protein n=1 Tax=Triparma retinervis TaxID=2557542 RepID=A0A9W7L6P7_9STRA|nr:hypothetical protein TrRE_jg5348 [Triparma retinervis]
MQSQELDLELLTYGERNSRLISSMRIELNELNSFNSSTGGYGAGSGDNVLGGKASIAKRLSSKVMKQKKVVIKPPAEGEGRGEGEGEGEGRKKEEEKEGIKDDKGNVLDPRFERSKSMLVAKPANQMVDLDETVIASVGTPTSSILKMAMLARKVEAEDEQKEEERRIWEERKRIEQKRLKAEEDRNNSLRRAAEASGMLPTSMMSNMKHFNKGMVSFGVGGKGK